MTNPFFSKEAAEIRDMWQSRLLRATKGKGDLFQTVLVVFAKEYPAAMQILLRVSFANFIDITLPTITGYATIEPNGKITAQVMTKSRRKARWIIWESEQAMRTEFGRVADKLKLDDADRIEMFGVLKKWIVADKRIDAFGRKLAS